MALNVSDRQGNHRGFLCSGYPGNPYNRQFAIVNLTEKRLEESELDLEKMEVSVAEIFACKNLLGKVNREKLEQVLQSLWEKEAHFSVPFDYTLAVKIQQIKRNPSFGRLFKETDPVSSKYVLYDVDLLELNEQGELVMEEPLDYLEEALEQEEGPKSALMPVYFKITDFPVVRLRRYGLIDDLFIGKDTVDYIGKDHGHATQITLLSGNARLKMTVPLPLYAKKGSTVIMYLDDRQIYELFTEGMIYRFRGQTP